MVALAVDSSTLVATSVVSAVITFGFCKAMDVATGAALVIAGIAGVALYAIGVIPIGLLAVVGLAMVGFIFKSLFSQKPPSE